MKRRSPWFAIRTPLPARRVAALKMASFLLPLAVWCAVSYGPWFRQTVVHVIDTGDSDFLQSDTLVPPGLFKEANDELGAAGKQLAKGETLHTRVSPVFLPAPHEVGKAFFHAFSTPPALPNDPWLHQSLLHSAQIIFWGFLLACVAAVPLGILCGTFDFFSKLVEPFVDFIRYMPAPMFGALCVTILGIDTAPKIAIIWVGIFFQTVLVVANTTRQVDPSLLEAAQTLGATRKSLLPKVILPAILPNLYNDLRIMLGAAWTMLIIAELIGAASGISYFINQQGKYRHFDNVYAGMLMIGIVGLTCDQLLAAAAPLLFPWVPKTGKASALGLLVGAVTFGPQRAVARRAAARHAGRAAAGASLAGASPAAVPPAGVAGEEGYDDGRVIDVHAA